MIVDDFYQYKALYGSIQRLLQLLLQLREEQSINSFRANSNRSKEGMSHVYHGISPKNNTNTKPLQSNRYMQNNNIIYQNIPQTKRLPQTLITHQQQRLSPNHNKPYLQRNQSFQNRQYNEQLIQLIAKIRSLEDDLLNQRFKNESLQRKILQNERVIDNLQFQLNKQSYQLQKYVHQIQLSNQKNFQILKYEKNLQVVGEEIQQLNDILVRRNHQYDLVCAENRDLIGEINKIIEESNLINIRVGMWMREVQAIMEEHKLYMVERGIIKENKQGSGNSGMGKVNSNNSVSNMINTSQLLATASPLRYPNQVSPNDGNNYNQGFLGNESITFKQYNQSGSYISFDPNRNFTLQLQKKLQVIKSLCTSLSCQLNTKSTTHEKQKMQLEQILMVQKQKYLKLQYEHKLLQQRIKDSEKKKDLIEKHYQDMKLQKQLNQMIKSEDDYLQRIEQLRQQNEQLKQQLQSLQQTQQYIEQVNGQEREGIIKAMQREKELLEETITQLTHQIVQIKQRLKQLQQQCQLLLTEKQQLILQHNDQSSKSTKKIRKLQQENYQYQIKIEQINGEMNLIRRELAIINQDRQQVELGS